MEAVISNLFPRGWLFMEPGSEGPQNPCDKTPACLTFSIFNLSPPHCCLIRGECAWIPSSRKPSLAEKLSVLFFLKISWDFLKKIFRNICCFLIRRNTTALSFWIAKFNVPLRGWTPLFISVKLTHFWNATIKREYKVHKWGEVPWQFSPKKVSKPNPRSTASLWSSSNAIKKKMFPSFVEVLLRAVSYVKHHLPEQIRWFIQKLAPSSKQNLPPSDSRAAV